MLPVLFLTRPAGEALRHWFLRVLLWEVMADVLVGTVLGLAMGRLLMWAERRLLIEGHRSWRSRRALALFTLAAVSLAGGTGILAVFVAGLAFDRIVDTAERTEEERVVEGVDASSRCQSSSFSG